MHVVTLATQRTPWQSVFIGLETATDTLMEKFLFKKIELWFVLLLMAFGLVGLIVFGAVVRNAAQGNDRFGALGKMSLAVAKIPSTARQMLRSDNAMVAFTRTDFAGKSGWNLDPQQVTDFSGYLLISRFDGDDLRHVVELFDLKTGQVVHSWQPAASDILQGTKKKSNVITFERWDTRHFRYIHPFIMADGSLLLKDHQSPLMRVDICGNLMWRQEDSFFHHRTEAGLDGTFWIPGRIEPVTNANAPNDQYDDTLTQVSADGKIIYEKSIQELLIENGQKMLLYATGAYRRDGMHSNDIQPVTKDGPHWKKGDLFVSLRHFSMIFLYRPSTNEIIWQQAGPWAAQHDVDIINDHTIAVFNNNSYRYAEDGRGQVDGVSEIVFYDFATDTTSRPYQELFQKHNIRTEAEGLFQILPNCYLLVEEENHGRILLFSEDGNLAAEFFNRAQNGAIYRLGWSRYIDSNTGEAELVVLHSANCG